MHAALVIEPPPPRVLRFSLGDELAEDVKVSRDPAPDETVREVIDCAVRYNRDLQLFRDPAIGAALDKWSSHRGSDAAVSVELEGVADREASVEVLSLQDSSRLDHGGPSGSIFARYGPRLHSCHGEPGGERRSRRR
jgi:hypothetical protein